MLAYLFSRFPVVSQTFCDTEMLAMEAAGHRLVIGSLNPPPNSFRHERLSMLKAEVIYPPPSAVLDLPLNQPPDALGWKAMAGLALEHDAKYGKSYKAEVRARNAWFFAREFKKRGVRHVHIHFANRATHTALFLKKAGFTYSFTAHAQDFMVDLGNDDLLREMIREASFTAAVSDYSRALLTKICPDAADRIHRVYNGIDATQFPQSGPRTSLLSTINHQPSTFPLRLISIGRLIEFKGFPVLLEAIAILRDNNIPVCLQIIGEGPQRPALEAQIERQNLQSAVRLCGVLSQEEIKKELAGSHAFVLACLTDSKGATDILPTVILEAMACGLPVVSTTLAGVPEMVRHGETGLLAPPGDAAALAAPLAALAQDSALRHRLGSAGLERVQEIFSLQKTAGHLASLFPPAVEDRSDQSDQSDQLDSSDPSDPSDPLTLALLDALVLPPGFLLELGCIGTHPQVTVIATRQTPPLSPLPDYLPDATVLEAAWRAHPALVARIETLRAETGPVDSEHYYLTARRAVYLTTQLPQRQWKKIHALRANNVLLAWLLHRLTGLPASATIEATHRESRTLLSKLLPDFTYGSNSDLKLACRFPDLLKLHSAPPPKRFLGLKLPSAPAALTDPAPVWRAWLDSPLAKSP